ncbi:MAG TPA: Xaa-Pro peptidase family protein [Thermoanaerobaculia bacterium]|nr:Xaa-Pro peptidase family protein [Thermoanaerobaculia bacterium]
MRHVRAFLILLAVASAGYAQEGVPLFTPDFPPDEFAARRAKVYEAIGPESLALVQGAPSPAGYVRFRQSNEFYYLSGIEVPHAYLLLDGSRKVTALYLPRRNVARERSEGRLLAAEDVEEIKKLSGINHVFALDVLGNHLANYASGSTNRRLFTPFSPSEGLATSRDLAVRAVADAMSDPWDARPAREAHLISLLRTRFPQFEIRDLSPTLDSLRLIKSELEIALIEKATRLASFAILEAMRSTAPGISEYELDAVAKYVFHRNGAQGEAYYSLIASGPNAIFPHYNAGKRVMREGDFLLFDYAPDVGYYMSDITRMWPVSGKFNAWQRELYGFYLETYRAFLKRIRPGATPEAIIAETAADWDAIFKRTRFSKPEYERAARTFVDQFRTGRSLGHWVGMATHDVGRDSGPLRAGMVFTIEPQFRVPEEKIYIRLEDLIVIGADSARNVSDFLPMDIDAIERVIAEEGMLQRYPRQR